MSLSKLYELIEQVKDAELSAKLNEALNDYLSEDEDAEDIIVDQYEGCEKRHIQTGTIRDIVSGLEFSISEYLYVKEGLPDKTVIITNAANKIYGLPKDTLI